MQTENASSAKREKQILSEMDSLESAIADLNSVMGEAQNRLDSVLRPVEDQPEKPTNSVEKNLVPFAENLRSFRYRVVNQSNSLRNMLDRLEL